MSEEQNAKRDIFNIGHGTININNYPYLTPLDVTLDEVPPPCSHWQFRQEEQDILTKFNGEKQLIEIIGLGGYGKSALAARIFEQAQSFEKKLWVSFRPLFSEEEFPAFKLFSCWLSRKFSYQINEQWTEEQIAIEAINRLSQQRCLLVLDNLETLLESTTNWRDRGYYRFILRWLEIASQGILLITSREKPELPNNSLSQTYIRHIGGLSVESGVAMMKAQHIQGTDQEIGEYVRLADGHPLLLNLTVGFLKNIAGDTPPIGALRQAEFNLLEIVGLHRGNPQTSLEIILQESLRRLDAELLNVIREVWAFPMPFTQQLLKVARDSEVTLEQLRKLAKRALLQEAYLPEGWTFQLQPLVRNFLQEQLLDFHRNNNNPLGEANTLIAIGDVLQFLDRRDEALHHYEEAIAIYRQVGARLGEANTLHEVGKLQQNPTETLNYLEQAQDIYVLIGDKYSQSRNLLYIADSQVSLKQKEAALLSLQKSADLATEINFLPLQNYAIDKINEIQNPRNQIGRHLFKLKPRQYIFLAIFAFLLIFIIKWLKK
jgi:tetratricopeptide (TPR) repeat protein